MTTNMEHQGHEPSDGDVKICEECIEVMKASAEKCRSLIERSSSSMCKGGLSTSAYVCEGIVKSMEKCIEAMTKNQGDQVAYKKSSKEESKSLM
ncbi:MAG: hypothetical protein B7Y39_04510 [Bdellovibrio sp. 28-41-41]|nr:MAG: hypothetical protein B7Y39_04510 [Bdellovibrio sp. 28-41-41]